MPETAPAPWEYSLHIPNDPRAVTVTRRTLRLILTLHGLIGLVDTAELLATELISNTVLHTKGPAALRLRFSAGVLRIGAWDADPAPPEPPVPLESVVDQEEGRGLALVRACSDLWGWQPLSRNGDRGKVVWCELSAAWPLVRVKRRPERNEEENMPFVTYFPGRGTVRETAYLEGKAEGILCVRELRGVPVTDSVRERITTCTELSLLDAWLERSLTVAQAEDLFTEDADVSE